MRLSVQLLHGYTPPPGIARDLTAFEVETTAFTFMERQQIVSRDPEVMNGALVFAGTRVPVEILIQHLAAGDSIDKFLGDFPTVSRDQAVGYLEMTLQEAGAA